MMLDEKKPSSRHPVPHEIEDDDDDDDDDYHGVFQMGGPLQISFVLTVPPCIHLIEDLSSEGLLYLHKNIPSLAAELMDWKSLTETMYHIMRHARMLTISTERVQHSHSDEAWIESAERDCAQSRTIAFAIVHARACAPGDGGNPHIIFTITIFLIIVIIFVSS